MEQLELIGKLAATVLVPPCLALAGLFFKLYRREVRRAAQLELEREEERKQKAERRPFLINGDLEEIRDAFDILMTADGNHKRSIRELKRAAEDYDQRIRELEGASKEGDSVHDHLMNRITRLEERLNRRGDAAIA